ncbi:hypothetical protein Tco_0346201 [Tanacetum coccineum]
MITTVTVSQFWAVSSKMSLSSALIETISLLIIVVVVAVVVVSICRSASTILGQMANLLAVTALWWTRTFMIVITLGTQRFRARCMISCHYYLQCRPGLCSASYSAVVGFDCSWKDHHIFFSFLPDVQHRHGSSHPSTQL